MNSQDYLNYLLKEDIAITHKVTLPSGKLGYCDISSVKSGLIPVYLWDPMLSDLLPVFSMSDFEIAISKVFKSSGVSNPRQFSEYAHSVITATTLKKIDRLTLTTL